MKLKIIFITLIFLNYKIAAQDSYILDLDTNNGKKFIHGVSSVKVIDHRKNKEEIGVIRSGKMNHTQSLKTRLPLNELLEEYFMRLSLSSPLRQQKELVIILNRFAVAENDEGFTEETGRFKYAADYFLSEANGQYKLLGCIDTSILVRSLDVTQNLLKMVDKSLCFLYEGVYNLPQSDRLYSIAEIENFEEEQKKNFKAYTLDSFENGCYITWVSFLALEVGQLNDKAKNKNGLFDLRALLDDKGEFINVFKKTKLVSYDNRLYLLYDNVLHYMEKRGSDFYIIGTIPRSNYNYAMSSGGSYLVMKPYKKTFPVIDIDYVPTPQELSDYYEFKVNVRNGHLVPVKRTVKRK